MKITFWFIKLSLLLIYNKLKAFEFEFLKYRVDKRPRISEFRLKKPR